jgi:hypothetical protein
MPVVFDKLGIRFVYPDNWQIDESELGEENRSVSVFSPSGAFWTVIVHPAGMNPQDLIDTAVGTMRQEYDSLDAEPIYETFGEQDLLGCEMHFYCLDLTNTAIVRSFATAEATFLLLCQVEDREFDDIGPVFEAITFSMLAPEASAGDFLEAVPTLASESPGQGRRPR